MAQLQPPRPELAPPGPAPGRDGAAIALTSARRTAWALAAMTVAVLPATAALLVPSLPQAFKVLLALLVAALWLVLAATLLSQSRRLLDTTGALRRFGRRIGGSDLPRSTVPPSADTAPPVSAFDAVAEEVERALAERDRRWRARSTLSADWYWETDAQLRYDWVSDDLASSVKLGLQPQDLIGRRHDEVPFYAPPEGGWGPLNARLAMRQQLRDIEIEVRRPGRSPVWISISARARRDADGHFLGYEGIGRDVTERLLAYRRLRDSEQRYAVMVSLSADWYWETDAQHRFSFIGQPGLDLLDARALHALGARRWELMPDATTDAEWAAHRALLDQRRPFRDIELLLRAPGRPARLVSVSGQPRDDEHGQFVGYHGVGSDITVRRQAEKLLLNRNARLERLVSERTAALEQVNRDLDAYSRQLAHELRTPISQVVGLSDLLRSRAWERLQDEEREWLLLQGKAGRTMSHTITALLDLARLGAAPLVLEPIDLSAMASGVIADLPWVERRAAVQWQVEAGLHTEACGPLMRVLLTNLLGNAAKFTRECPAPVVSFGRDDRQVYYVQDNGVGFDPRQATQLFQPFTRLHDVASYQGTGLGLSIVRRIVERHGGSVRASGLPGAGARFEFRLAAGTGDKAGAGETTDDAMPPLA
jgi:PAS domain S-box-containing protein